MTDASRRSITPAVLFALAIASCTGSEDFPDARREVLPDGRVVVSYAGETPLQEDTLIEDLRLGSLDGNGPTTFGTVRGIAVSSDGAIHVLDQLASEVRVFSAEGVHLATLGGEGQGPGEIGQASGLTLAPDETVWVNDYRNGAIIGLSLDGTEIGRHPLMVGGYAFTWSGFIDSDGVFWERWSHSVGEVPFDIAATGSLETSSRLYYKSFDPRTGAYDSIQIGIAPSRSYRAAYEGGQVMMGIPFDSRLLAAMSRERDIWTAMSDRYEISKTTSEGDTLLVLRRDATRDPVTEDDVAPWREGIDQRYGQVPRIRVEMEALIPDSKPLLSALKTDDRGNLWVGREVPEGDGPLFDVYDARGTYLRSVRLLPGTSLTIGPVIRNGRLYALVRGEFEEDYVVRAPLPPVLIGP